MNIEHFESRFLKNATQEEIKEYNELNEKSKDAFNKLKEYESVFGKELNDIVNKYADNLTCRVNCGFDNWGLLYIKDETIGVEYPLKYVYDKDSNNLLKSRLVDDDWQCTDFSRSIATRTFGFEMLHNFDINIAMRECIDSYCNSIRELSEIWISNSTKCFEMISNDNSNTII